MVRDSQFRVLYAFSASLVVVIGYCLLVLGRWLCGLAYVVMRGPGLEMNINAMVLFTCVKMTAMTD